MAARPITTAKTADKRTEQEARLWKKELQLAGKREKEWREQSEKIIKRYRGEERKKNRYNVLWANTEILLPAIYNSKPNPDVRRRFRDADPIGKAVSEVLERSLYVVADGYDTDCAIRNDVFDSLLIGRGVSRIRYLPHLKTVEKPKTQDADVDNEPVPEGTAAEAEEEVDYEQVCIEHVDWRDYREGYGRTWEEVPWVAFRHKLTKKDAERKLESKDLSGVEYALPTPDDPKKPGEETNETQKVAEFWEIWDKLGNRVFFTQESVQKLLFPTDNPEGAPPLEFEGFFPIPEPLRMVENTGSLLPIAPFVLYEEQANQLDRISGRIDRIVEEMRLRGVYDAKLSELSDVMDAADGTLVPVQNAQAWMQAGLDKAISWMPIEQGVAVLNALYDARDRQKAIIDDLTGISDIVRGTTDPNETAAAQNIKSNYANVRLQRMQKEVQRYSRDLLRLCASVLASKFAPQTLAQMTDLKFPTAQEKAQLQQQIMAAQQSGQQGPDPELLKVPSWDEIMQLLHSPALRQWRIDVETDSTIAGALDSDMKGLAAVMMAINQTMEGLAPLVQSQALPVDAAKELVLTVIRRAKMGSAVEDAFDKLKAPQPPPQPQDHAIEVAKIKADSDQKIEGMRAQNDKEKLAAQAQMDAIHQQLMDQREQFSQQLKQSRDQHMHEQQLASDQFSAQVQAQKELALEQQKAANSLMESKLDAAVKIIVASIAAKSQEAIAEASAEREVTGDIG